MEEDVLDIIQKIQEARNPKYFLWNIIKDLEWFASDKYDWIIGKKGDVVYFSYDNEIYTLYYDYNKIYEILKTKYHLNEQVSNELVGGMVSEHFKLKVDTTYGPIGIPTDWVSEHFKLKVDTTRNSWSARCY